jgi:hypothetical protein
MAARSDLQYTTIGGLQTLRVIRCLPSERTDCRVTGRHLITLNDSRHSPAHAQDRKGSIRKPPFPHARSAIDTVSSMLQVGGETQPAWLQFSVYNESGPLGV